MTHGGYDNQRKFVIKDDDCVPIYLDIYDSPMSSSQKRPPHHFMICSGRWLKLQVDLCCSPHITILSVISNELKPSTHGKGPTTAWPTLHFFIHLKKNGFFHPLIITWNDLKLLYCSFDSHVLSCIFGKFVYIFLRKGVCPFTFWPFSYSLCHFDEKEKKYKNNKKATLDRKTEKIWHCWRPPRTYFFVVRNLWKVW